MNYININCENPREVLSRAVAILQEFITSYLTYELLG